MRTRRKRRRVEGGRGRDYDEKKKKDWKKGKDENHERTTKRRLS